MHILVTRRLTLRPPTWLDAEDIAAGLSNWNVARMLGPVPYPYFSADALEWIDGPAAATDDLVYTIHRERLIGVVSLHGVGGVPKLGYWLAEPWHGHGYMTEAAAALISHAFATRPLPAIVSSVFVDNPASLRVQQKLGFETTGLTEIYSRPRGAAVQGLTTRLTAEAWAADGTSMAAA